MSDTARIRREGRKDQMDAFWDHLMQADPDPRRAYPRVRFDAPLVLRVREEDIRARMHDISRGGVQVRGDRKIAARIAPREPGERVTVDIRVSLPGIAGDPGTTPAPGLFAARCVMVHATELAEEPDGMAMGFCFIALASGSQQVLERFILRSLEPASLEPATKD